MNARFSEIKNVELFATDQSIGKVVDLLIEDKNWKVRYLVVDILDNASATSNRVLISPAAISKVALEDRSIICSLDSQRVKASPTLDAAKSVSRKHELALVEHYGWPIYWLGQTILPPQTLDRLAGDTEPTAEKDGDSNLRSAVEICGYQIRSRNGKAGVMNDLVVNTRTWNVINAVAESSTWLPLESSMFSTKHVQTVNWSQREITVDLSREALVPQSFSTASFTNAGTAGFAAGQPAK